jgi:hypothetical protein
MSEIHALNPVDQGRAIAPRRRLSYDPLSRPVDELTIEQHPLVLTSPYVVEGSTT